MPEATSSWAIPPPECSVSLALHPLLTGSRWSTAPFEPANLLERFEFLAVPFAGLAPGGDSTPSKNQEFGN